MPDNLYEAMFVVDAAKGGSAFPDTIRHIAGLLTRNGADIQRMERWEERKLAYPIRRVKRGIYILVYFAADGSAIDEIRRAADLSEEVLRVLILRAEQVSPVKGQLYSIEGEEVEAPAEAPVAEAPAAGAETPAADAEKSEAEQDADDAAEGEAADTSL